MTPAPEATPTVAAWDMSWRKRAQVALIAGIGTPLIKLLASTWRWRVEGAERYRAAEADGRHAIMAFWHGRIVHGTARMRDRGIVVITSENFDGEWIARIIRRFGFGTARGSTSRGARKALHQLVRESQAASTAFTVDGPRGPARVAQPGAVWLSKVTGNPVMPFHAEASSAWTLRSWDQAQIPKPFATVAFVFAEPFVVPRETDADGLETYRRRLEDELAAAERRCHALLAGPRS